MLIPRLLLCCQSLLHCHDVIYARVAISGVWRQTLAIVANGIRGTRSRSHSSISSHYRPTYLVGICDLHRERHRIDHIYLFSRFCQVLFYLIGGSGPSAPVYQISATRPCLCCSTTILHPCVILSCIRLLLLFLHEPLRFLPRTLIFLA